MRMVLDARMTGGWTLTDALDFAARLKLAGVLLPMFTLAAAPGELTAEGRERLRRMAASSGAAIAGLTGVLDGLTHALVGGDTTRAAARVRLEDCVRLCYDLGGRLACVDLPDWDELRGGLKTGQAQTLAAGVLRACAPLAESRRVTLCLEGPGGSGQFVNIVGHGNVRLACAADSLLRLGTPPPGLRLVRARLTDDAKALGEMLASLRYGSWLSLRVADAGDPLKAAAAWLAAFRGATSRAAAG